MEYVEINLILNGALIIRAWIKEYKILGGYRALEQCRTLNIGASQEFHPRELRRLRTNLLLGNVNMT